MISNLINEFKNSKTMNVLKTTIIGLGKVYSQDVFGNSILNENWEKVNLNTPNAYPLPPS